jgi:hypothetical protein
VENKNSIARKLDGAFLLIGAAAENPDHKVRGIFEFNQEPYKIGKKEEAARVVTNRITPRRCRTTLDK